MMTRYRFARFIAGLGLAALSACGGGTNGDAPQQVKPETVAVAGAVVNGVGDSSGAEITVKGVKGLFRVAQLLTPGDSYTGKVEELSGPYAVGFRVSGSSGEFYLVSVVTKQGTANVTPLTTLAVAQLYGADPTTFFRSLSANGDAALSKATDAALTAAQDKVRRILLQDYGFTVPASVGDFFKSPFTPKAGDPMFDTLTALNTRLKARGTDAFALARAIGKEAAFCNAERVTLTRAGDARDFCPARKTSLPDAADAGIVNYRFITNAGAVLVVAGRGAAVLSATLQQADGTRFGCTGSACAGLTLGNPAADASRPVAFVNVALALIGGTSGTSGSVTVSGTLQASKPGAALPPLPCDTNRYYVAYADNRVDATCAAPDTSLGIGVGDAYELDGSRLLYRFQSDGSVEPTPAILEVRAENQRLVSVLVRDIDPATGKLRMLYKCSGSDCNDVTIGPARDDLDSIPPYTLRSRLVTLDGTVLSAFNPDGTPSAAGPAVVTATLDTFYPFAPARVFASTAACLSPALRLSARLSYETTPHDICPPAVVPPDSGFNASYYLNTRYVFGTTDLVFKIQGVDLDANGQPLDSSSAVEVQLNGSGVASAVFHAPSGQATYQCSGTACAGLTISAPNAAGERTVTMSNTVLHEVDTAGLPEDRSVTLNGSFIAPPLPLPLPGP